MLFNFSDALSTILISISEMTHLARLRIDLLDLVLSQTVKVNVRRAQMQYFEV